MARCTFETTTAAAEWNAVARNDIVHTHGSNSAGALDTSVETGDSENETCPTPLGYRVPSTKKWRADMDAVLHAGRDGENEI